MGCKGVPFTVYCFLLLTNILHGQENTPALQEARNAKNDVIVVDVAQAGAVFRISLPTLIEGLEYKFIAKVKNNTDQVWNGLRTSVGCRCVKVDALPESTLTSSNSVELSFRVTPTANQLSQELSLFAKQGSEVAGEVREVLLTKLVLTADTLPPVVCSHHQVVFEDSKEVEIQLTPADKRFAVKTEGIRLSDGDFTCKSAAGLLGSVGVSIGQRSTIGQSSEFRKSVLINIPLVFDGSDDVRWFSHELILAKRGDVVVSPQTAIFRFSEECFRCSLMVQDRRGGPIKEDLGIEFQLTHGKDSDEVVGSRVSIDESRSLAGNRTYLRLKLEDFKFEKRDQQGHYQLSLISKDKVLQQVPVIFLR